MSVQPAPWPQPSPQIAAAVVRMYRGRRAPLAVVIRDELGVLYADEAFAAAFGVRGRPGWSPGRLMLVTVLQYAEHLTDRQAAEAVRTRIDWKYCLVRREALSFREGVRDPVHQSVAALSAVHHCCASGDPDAVGGPERCRDGAEVVAAG